MNRVRRPAATTAPRPRLTPGEVWARHRRWIAALALGLAVFAGLRAVAPEDAGLVDVWAPTHDLAAGHVLVAGDLAPVRLGAAGAADAKEAPGDADGAGSPPHPVGPEAVGRVVAVPWPAGVPLHSGALAGSELLRGLPSGEVAVPLSWEDGAAARLVHTGDLVDVVVSAPGDGDEPRSSVVVTDARVVWCQSAASEGGDGWLDSSRDAPGGATVVLAVPRARAAGLSSAPQRGAVSLVVTG